jgi:epoxyqueuosine reductase
MREKLEQLRAAIEELAPGAETRVYVDTGPVIERAFARFSGLGWMGKNTCIINEEKGSFLFLGVILTNLPLAPDQPAPDRCGTCRACLDACPTGALSEPYKMDSTKCISYLTIELKGSMPRNLRPGVGRNVFGCDICQDVCPWNEKSRSQESGVRSQEGGFEPISVSIQPSAVSSQQAAGGRASSTQNQESQIANFPDTRNPAPGTFSLLAPPLEALAAMTEEEFRKTFAHSPIKRAKYRGWLRNLSVAMGNSGDPRFLPTLQELSQDTDPIVREHAAWAMDRIREG